MTIANAPEDRWTEDEWAAADAASAAWARGDDEAAAEYSNKVRMLPEFLLALKNTFGAGYVREEGYNTELAEKYYGQDWLDREE